MEKVVLGLEPTKSEAKFIVVTNPVLDKQFLIGFETKQVGGHTDLYCLLERSLNNSI
ncbi:MAG: hypothetical protein AABX11_01150 [Nanoarchaeota archaeon]